MAETMKINREELLMLVRTGKVARKGRLRTKQLRVENRQMLLAREEYAAMQRRLEAARWA